MVSSSVTTNDGGASILQGLISRLLPADYSTSEGTRTIKFGERVRMANDYLTATYESSTGVKTVAPGNVVQAADD